MVRRSVLLGFAISVHALAPACSGGPSSSSKPVPPTQRASFAGAADQLAPTALVSAPRLKHDTRPLPADIAQYRWPTAITISPAGDWVVYLLSTHELDETATIPKRASDDTSGGWKSATQLWIARTDGTGSARQLTQGTERVSSPRWSPGWAIGCLSAQARGTVPDSHLAAQWRRSSPCPNQRPGHPRLLVRQRWRRHDCSSNCAANQRADRRRVESRGRLQLRPLVATGGALSPSF